MNHTKSAFFITIYRILVKGKKRYATPSIDALLDLVSKRHGKTVGRRWAFQCLHDIETLGFINRRPLYRKDAGGQWHQVPSLVTITLKGARKLFDLGVDGAARLCKEIMGWIHSGDKRWPDYKSSPSSSVVRVDLVAPIKLGKIFSSAGIVPVNV